jgi:protoporphyrinogen oxidase
LLKNISRSTRRSFHPKKRGNRNEKNSCCRSRSGGTLLGIGTAENGYEVEVFESGPRVGGMSKSIKDGEFIFDVGSHVIHTNSEKYKGFISQLLGKDLLVKNITAKTYFDGKFRNFPPIMRDIFDFPPKKALKIFFSLSMKYPNRFRDKKSNFEDQLLFLGGPDLYREYFEGYTTKFWGVPPKTLSSEWVPRRVIPRLMGRSALANEWQAYPRYGGIETISKRMAKLIEEGGGKIHLNSQLKSIIAEDQSVSGIIIGMNEGDKQFSCDALISTIPLPTLYDILGKRFELRYRSMVFVFLKLKVPRVLYDTTICFFRDRKLHFTRIYEMSKYSPENCPKGYTSVGLEIPCFYEDELWNKDDEALVSEVVQGLEAEKIIKKEDLVAHRVHRERYAYPIPTIRYYKEIERLRSSIEYRNLFLAGRMGYFQYFDMCDAMENGAKAVKELTSRQIK